jgi:apolipoprotein N-acyltransferase
MDELAQRHHTALIVGFPLIASDLYHAYNALLVLGNGQGLYRKRFLVPFGEYVPFENTLRGLLNILNLPMSEFIPGPIQQNLPLAAGIPFAPFICYEIAYAKAVRSLLPQAQLLVVTSNDAWFGQSWALVQHLQIAQFQAIATGRYAAVVSNTGLTAIIKPDGTIAAALPPFQQGVLTGSVQTYMGATPWVRFGNRPLLMLGLIVLGWLKPRKKISPI